MIINAFSVTDKKYLDILYVMIDTIKRNKKDDTKMNYFLFIDDLDDKTKNYFADLEDDMFKMYCFEARNYAQYIHPPVNSYLYYLRCLAPKIFKDLERILYFDTDIVCINNGIEELWETDLTDKYLAAAIDIEEAYRDEEERINVGKNYEDNNYFNTGVMLMNLKKMREDGYDKLLQEYLLNWPKELQCILFDQTLLNWVFKQNVKMLSTKWNNSILAMVKRDEVWYWKHYQTQNPVSKLQNAVFLHFKGIKPWFGSLSPWQEYQFPYRPLAKSIYFQLYHQLAKKEQF